MMTVYIFKKPIMGNLNSRKNNATIQNEMIFNPISVQFNEDKLHNQSIINDMKRNEFVNSNNFGNDHSSYVNNRSSPCHSYGWKEKLFLKKSSHINNLKRSSNNLIQDLLSQTAPPISTCNQSEKLTECNSDFENVNSHHDLLKLTRYPPPNVIDQSDNANLSLIVSLEPELIYAKSVNTESKKTNSYVSLEESMAHFKSLVVDAHCCPKEGANTSGDSKGSKSKVWPISNL